MEASAIRVIFLALWWVHIMVIFYVEWWQDEFQKGCYIITAHIILTPQCYMAHCGRSTIRFSTSCLFNVLIYLVLHQVSRWCSDASWVERIMYLVTTKIGTLWKLEASRLRYDSPKLCSRIQTLYIICEYSYWNKIQGTCVCLLLCFLFLEPEYII